MHKMDIVGPHTNSIESSLWSAHAVQDIDEVHSVSSQAEGVTSIKPFYLIPRRVFFCITGSGGSDIRDPDMSLMVIERCDGISNTSGAPNDRGRGTDSCVFPHDYKDIIGVTDMKT